MNNRTEILKVIDETIRFVWENEIASDYNDNWIMNEDELKSALYFRLRNHLEVFLKKHDLRIFTKFQDAEFLNSGYRPDMVIARLNMNSNAEYWRLAVPECLVVIELKFKSRFHDQTAIYSDYEKLKAYIQTLNIHSQIYMATIWEHEDDRTPREPMTAEWAKGKVTELNASFRRDDGTPQFYVAIH